MTSTEPLLEAAADYLGRGLAVIALSGKAPNGAVHRHGLKDAFRGVQQQPDALFAAFRHPETTGIGILTEFPYFVVDIDGPEGAEQWMQLAGDEAMDATWVASTGRGLHLWYSDLQQRSTRVLGPKLDLKATGGYVAAPPSLHPSGTSYVWLHGPAIHDTPLEAPEALIRLLDEQDIMRARRIISKEASKRVREAPREGWFTPSWGFEGVLKTVREAEEGNRNAVLYWGAYTLAEDDADAEEFDNLYSAALENGLGRREARLTIRSAQKAAMNG